MSINVCKVLSTKQQQIKKDKIKKRKKKVHNYNKSFLSDNIIKLNKHQKRSEDTRNEWTSTFRRIARASSHHQVKYITTVR